MTNGEIQSNVIASGNWGKKLNKMNFSNEGSIETLKANMILLHPWNYETIHETIQEKRKLAKEAS